jgi:hypothetical protein
MLISTFVAAPDLIRTFDNLVPQQIRIHLVLWMAFAGGWPRGDSIESSCGGHDILFHQLSSRSEKFTLIGGPKTGVHFNTF